MSSLTLNCIFRTAVRFFYAGRCPRPCPPEGQMGLQYSICALAHSRAKKSTPTPGVHQTLYPPLIRPWPVGGGVIIERG